MPADAGAPDAPGPHVRAPPVCRHWSRGGCLYGETCRFAHPPDALGASPGVPESAGVLRRDSAVSPARTNRRVKKKGRCGHLRRFLIDTFGAECVGSGAPILDVGGGRGELAFELCNLNGADAVVVDVVPMRLARYESKLERGWYDRSAPLAKYNDRERRPSTSSAANVGTRQQHETPKHLRLLWSPALWRVRDDAASRGDEEDDVSFLAESPTESPTTRTIDTIDVISFLERDLTAATRERHAVATYSAWAAATRVAFSARGFTKKKKKHGNDGLIITKRDGIRSEDSEEAFTKKKPPPSRTRCSRSSTSTTRARSCAARLDRTRILCAAAPRFRTRRARILGASALETRQKKHSTSTSSLALARARILCAAPRLRTRRSCARRSARALWWWACTATKRRSGSWTSRWRTAFGSRLCRVACVPDCSRGGGARTARARSCARTPSSASIYEAKRARVRSKSRAYRSRGRIPWCSPRLTHREGGGTERGGSEGEKFRRARAFLP